MLVLIDYVTVFAGEEEVQSKKKWFFTGTDIKDGFYHSDVVYQKI